MLDKGRKINIKKSDKIDNNKTKTLTQNKSNPRRRQSDSQAKNTKKENNIKKEPIKKTDSRKENIKKLDNKKMNNKKTTNDKVDNKKVNNEKTIIKKTSNKKVISEKANYETNKIHSKKNKSKKLTVLIMFITLSLCAIAATYFLLKTPEFNITSIITQGNSKISTDSIIASSGIKLGDNIFKSFIKINKRNVLSIPYILNMNISINFPSEFIIKVNERKSIYYAYDKEKNLYYKLDENGIILEECSGLDSKQQELLVNGITFDTQVKLGSKINDIDYSKILVYRKIEEVFYNKFTGYNITKVSFENSLTIIYLNDKIEAILPNDTELEYNISFLKDIIENIGDVQGTIDMTKENPTFIKF